MMYLGTGGMKRHDLHDLHKPVKQIADTLKRWSDWEGLRVVTHADRKRREAEWEAEDHAAREAGAADGAESGSAERA
jgi:hypothetical protein